MVDAFGSRRGLARGREGPRGRPGLDGVDALCRWMPNGTLRLLRESDEQTCLLLRDLSRDVVVKERNAVAEWRTRSRGGSNFVAVRASRSISTLGRGRHALNFDESLYKCDDVVLQTAASRYLSLCITFISGADDERVILTNFSAQRRSTYREITVDSFGVRIDDVVANAKSSTHIACVASKWTTLFVEWYPIGLRMAGRYVVNGTRGELIQSPPSGATICGALLGGRRERDGDAKSFKGSISSIESLLCDKKPEGGMPRPLCDAQIDDQIEPSSSSSSSSSSSAPPPPF